MISKKEIIEAIEHYKNAPATIDTCKKLAALYTVKDHLYCEDEPEHNGNRHREISNYSGAQPPEYREEKAKIQVSDATSDFLIRVDGMDAKTFWKVMDELVETIKIINPRLYDAFMRKLND